MFGNEVSLEYYSVTGCIKHLDLHLFFTSWIRSTILIRSDWKAHGLIWELLQRNSRMRDYGLLFARGNRGHRTHASVASDFILLWNERCPWPLLHPWLFSAKRRLSSMPASEECVRTSEGRLTSPANTLSVKTVRQLHWHFSPKQQWDLMNVSTYNWTQISYEKVWEVQVRDGARVCFALEKI